MQNEILCMFRTCPMLCIIIIMSSFKLTLTVLEGINKVTSTTYFTEIFNGTRISLFKHSESTSRT